jgi:hypothetical protein
MQRKQQVGECWVCVIFFSRVVVSQLVRWVRMGDARPPSRGAGGFGGSAPEKKKILRKHDTCLGKHVMYLGGFSAHVFC